MIKRFWNDAIAKIQLEGSCRLTREGGCEGPLEAAHTVARARQDRELYVLKDTDGKDRAVTFELARLLEKFGIRLPPDPCVILYVDPESILPLCRAHHQKYDARRISILEIMTLEEQTNAAKAAGGIAGAYKRTTSQKEV